jgi:hypothetical protein
MCPKLLDVLEDAPDKFFGGGGVIERDIISYRFQIAEGRLSPDQFSHRAIRFRACLCVRTLPS